MYDLLYHRLFEPNGCSYFLAFQDHTDLDGFRLSCRRQFQVFFFLFHAQFLDRVLTCFPYMPTSERRPAMQPPMRRGLGQHSGSYISLLPGFFVALLDVLRCKISWLEYPGTHGMHLALTYGHIFVMPGHYASSEASWSVLDTLSSVGLY